MRVLAAGRRHIASRWRAWARFVWSAISVTPPGMTIYPKWMQEPPKPMVQAQRKIFGVGFDWGHFEEGETPNLIVFSTGGHTEHAAQIVREWPPLSEHKFDPDWQQKMGVDLYRAFPDLSDPWPKMHLTGYILEHAWRTLMGVESTCARDEPHKGRCVNLNIILGEE